VGPIDVPTKLVPQGLFGRAPARLAAFVALVGINAFSCGAESPANPEFPPTECPSPVAARPLMQRLILDILRTTAWVGQTVDAHHRAYGLHPFGFVGVLGRLTYFPTASTCTQPAVFRPMCGLVAGIEPFDFCHRGRCEAAGVNLEDVYLVVQPRTDPDDRQRLEYESRTFPGRVAYDPNPFITYRIDDTHTGHILVTADLRQNLTFTPTQGNSIRLSHSGTVTVHRGDRDIDAISLELSFPHLTERGPQVVVSVDLNADGFANGAVTAAGRRLATITGGDTTLNPGPSFIWEGDCGS
jgi:hypothetical protein